LGCYWVNYLSNLLKELKQKKKKKKMSASVTFGLMGFTLVAMAAERTTSVNPYVATFGIFCTGLSVMYIGYKIRKGQNWLN